MKVLIICLALVAASQAVDWSKIKPLPRNLPSTIARPPSSINNRIVGGSLATEGQFPYQVGIFMDGSYFCGGSLIMDNTVLTAGHCVKDFGSFEVHCGALNIRNEAEPGRVIVTTSDMTLHESYIALLLWNDIGLIRLGQSVSGPNIGTIRVPSRSMANDLFENEIARISGWGKPSDAAPGISDDLKFTDLMVISNADCQAVYGATVREGVICCGTNGGATSTCNGDSGGPMVFMESDGQYTEIGVVSFVHVDGCESGNPAGFTRVTFYLDWLATNVPGLDIRP